MRILCINHEYPPIGAGGANACRHLVQEFRAQRHRVLVVTSSFAGLPRLCRDFGAAVWRVPSIRRRLDRSNFVEVAAFAANGCIRAVREAFRFRPDATLAFFTIPGGAVALWLRLLLGIPYVVSLRGADVPGFLNDHSPGLKLAHLGSRSAVQTIWRHATHVVSNSTGLLELARQTAPWLRFRVIPNGVDADFFVPREGPRPAGPVRVLFAGRFNSQKGLPVLAQALGRLRGDDLPRWRLRLVGDGPMRDQVLAALRQAHIADRTDLLGWLGPQALAAEYRQADLFVLPSFSEGMPNVVLEAMASGLAVVATDIAGNNELVRPGENGLLVPAGEVGPLAQALRRLIGDIGQCEQFGRRGRQIVVREYAWRRVADAYLALLEESAARRSGISAWRQRK